jgi:hypothetical protein
VKTRTKAMHSIITTKSGRVWEWAVLKDGLHVAGGYCRTKADAKHDAGCWIKTAEWKPTLKPRHP